MKILKRIIVVLIGLFCVVWAISLLTGYTIVIPISKYFSKERTLQSGDTINPLRDLDFSEGDWSAYLIMDWNDFKDLHSQIKKGTCLKTNDINLLNKMKNDWNFKYTGSDMATSESQIYFLKDGKIVFRSGIVIDKSTEGLQSKEYGWLEPIDKNALSRYCKDFKRVYWPLIFL